MAADELPTCYVLPTRHRNDLIEPAEEELVHTVFPHPTLSGMMHESVLHAYGKAIHT